MTTPRLNLSTIEANQAQKHVPVNDSLHLLDALVQTSVLSRSQTTPPGSPTNGDAYIVASGGAGDWLGLDDALVVFDGSAWAAFTPKPGWIAFVQDEDLAYRYLAGWAVLPIAQTLALLGINGTPDNYNKFLVQSEGVIFNNVGSHQRTTINKAAAANDAALNLQTNWSTRALAGLLGSDDYSVKVSPDGSAFHDALVVDHNTGRITFPNGVWGTGSGSGQFGGQIIAISGEESGAFTVGNYQSMGNGDTNIAGAVMPFPGKVLAASMSVSAGAAGVNIASMSKNKTEETGFQVSVTYSGSGFDVGYTDFSAAPLTFAAGDALNMIANTTSGAQDVVTTFFVIFD